MYLHTCPHAGACGSEQARLPLGEMAACKSPHAYAKCFYMCEWMFGDAAATSESFKALYRLLCTDCELCFLAALCRFAASGSDLRLYHKRNKVSLKAGEICALTTLQQTCACVDAYMCRQSARSRLGASLRRRSARRPCVHWH